VIEILPDDTKSLYRRALANWHLGEVDKATADLEGILKMKVSDYNALQESSTTKKLARSMLRQIEASEERAELMEQKMARALAVTIPITGSAVGGGLPPRQPEAPPAPKLEYDDDDDDDSDDGPILEDEEPMEEAD
jgi:hypothetical protein